MTSKILREEVNTVYTGRLEQLEYHQNSSKRETVVRIVWRPNGPLEVLRLRLFDVFFPAYARVMILVADFV